MKRIIPLLLVVIFCVSATNTYGQVTEFPYTEGFDNETFVQGTDVYFITNWLGNYVDGLRIFQEESNVRSGVGALGLWPYAEEGEDEEEVEIIAQVDLDLSGLENVVTKFWVATVATGDMKHVKLYVKLSTNGGQSFGPKLLMGYDPRGFENVDTPYQEFTYALHPEAFLNSNVVLQFMVKAGARKGIAAKVLIDDVYIYAAPEDIFPPQVFEPLINSVTELEIRFSEPVSPETANNLLNYTFTSGVSPPEITSAVLSDKHLVTLTLDPGIGIGKYYDLEIANVEDLAGNPMETATVELIYNPLATGLVITEIMYDEPPVGQNDYLEFIELYNVTDEPIELGGLRFKGGIASGNLPEYTLLPGEYWVTAKDAETFTSFFGVPAHEWRGGNLSNDDPESIYIQNTDHHSEVMIDSLTYRKGAPWPNGAGGLGYSMELIDPTVDNSDPLNWNDAVNYVGVFQGYDIYASPGEGLEILSTDDNIEVDAIGYYPNPVHDILYVDTQVVLTKVEIYTVLGNKINEYTSNLSTIETSHLSKGMYFVKLYAKDELVTVRIIKN
jgi:hypothetical protein